MAVQSLKLILISICAGIFSTGCNSSLDHYVDIRRPPGKADELVTMGLKHVKVSPARVFSSGTTLAIDAHATVSKTVSLGATLGTRVSISRSPSTAPTH